MKFKTVIDKTNNKLIIVEQNNTWKSVQTELNLLELLDKKETNLSDFSLFEIQEENYQEIIPFQPAAYRDFMLYEKHAEDPPAPDGFPLKLFTGVREDSYFQTGHRHIPN